eukprot:225752-Heterocapsa_arctica.AAC.1
MAMIKAVTECEEEAEIDARKGQRNQQDKDSANMNRHDKRRQWGGQAGQSSQGSQQEGGGSSTAWTPKRRAWAAKGYEDLLRDDSEEDREQGQGGWGSRWNYDKNKEGKKY